MSDRPSAAVAVGAVRCRVAASRTSDVPTTAMTATSWFALMTRYTSSGALAAARATTDARALARLTDPARCARAGAAARDESARARRNIVAK